MNELVAGRIRNAQLVRMYIYDKKHIENDGEPFSYTRVCATRKHGSGYDMFGVIDLLKQEMSARNFISATELPVNAYRILPNMYIHTKQAFARLFNMTALYKRKDNPFYLVHNMVFTNCDVPSRPEMFSIVNQTFQSAARPLTAEEWQVKHCLTDVWANVCTQVASDHVLWIHLRQMKRKVFRGGPERSLETILDNGRPGNVYSRAKFF